MPTPGMIATDMQQALRDLEDALVKLATALGLEPYEPPAIRHPDRAYIDMVRTRSLADWLQNAADALRANLDGTGGTSAEHLLARLTKAQLVGLASDLGVDVSEGQRKDDIIAALVAWAQGA